MNRTITLYACFLCITATVLAGCAAREASTIDYSELLSLRTTPDGNELKDECTCLQEDIVSINQHTENFEDSRYYIYYQALDREKISALQSRADAIGCNYPLSQQ